MADISDVTAYLAQAVAGVVYPNGTGQSSIINAPVRIFEGWPQPDVLDLDMQGKKLVNGAVAPNGVGPVQNVSVFPMPGATAQVFQVLDEPYVVVPAVHGVSYSVLGSTVTLTGTPGATEFVTVIVDHRKSYSRGGANTAAICAALLADLIGDFPGSTASGSTLTIAGQTDIVVRVGAQAKMAQVTHRQRHSVMVTIWANTPQARTALSAPIDVALKANLRATMPDTSQAIILYEKTNVLDTWETVAIYRRDLIYSVEYATLETWTAYEVTSVTTTYDPSSLAADYGNGHGSAIITIIE